MNTGVQPFTISEIRLADVSLPADTKLDSLKEIAARQGSVRRSDDSLLVLHVMCDGRIMATDLETKQQHDVFALYEQGMFEFEPVTHISYFEMINIAELKGFINWLDTDVIEQVWFDSLCNVRISAAHEPSRLLPANLEEGYRCEPVGMHAVLMGRLWHKSH